MKRVNLIPQYRKQAMLVRTRGRRWIVACAGYALFLLVSIVVSSLVRVSDNRSIQTQITRTEHSIETGHASINDLQARLDHSTSILRANRAVGSQPDWGVLLALVAEAAQEEIVLRVCRLEPLGPARATTVLGMSVEDTKPSGHITLELGGIGLTQNTVAQFVLRMEQMPLFDHVKLIDTKLEPFLSSDAVAFRLECQLDPFKEAQP